MNEIRDSLRAQLLTGAYAHKKSKNSSIAKYSRRASCCSTKGKQRLEARLSLTSLFIALVKICIAVVIAVTFVKSGNLAIGLFIFCALPYFAIYQLMTMKKELPEDIPYRTPAQFYRSQALQIHKSRKERQNKRARHSSRNYISNETPIVMPEYSSKNTEFTESIDNQDFWLSAPNNTHFDDDDRYIDPVKRKFYGIEPKISSCIGVNSLDITSIENEMTPDCSLFESSIEDISGFVDGSLSLD